MNSLGKAKGSQSDRGFTLIELLVALGFLSMGLLGVASLTGSIIKGNIFSSHLTTATTLAHDKMEAINHLGYAGTPLSDTTETEDYGSIAGFSAYKRVTVIDVGNPGTGMKKVSVTVYWESDSRSVPVRTLLAR